MLVLGIETSSLRGSVALVEDGQLLAEASHQHASAHGERLLGLIDTVFRQAGRSQRELHRVAVGRGPGTFTGLRIGLALAQGIASGLAIRAVGIGSLRAMAAGVPRSCPGLRWPVLDARRAEVFLACYGADGSERVSPRAVARGNLPDSLMHLARELPDGTSQHLLVGHASSQLPELAAAALASLGGNAPRFRQFQSEASDWPSAAAVARLGSTPNEGAPAAPEYLRDADAVMPSLPASPLHLPRVLPG